MLNVILAQPRGFCAGVDRAIDIVEKALALYGPPIYVRHEIVHNRWVVDDLKSKGVVFVEEVSEVPDGAITIFSAHGISEKVENEARLRNLPVIDATCPLVTKVHREAQRYETEERELILIGHKGHPEVEGTSGRVKQAMHVISTPEDVGMLEVTDPGKLAYVTQTTLSLDDTKEVIEALKRRFPTIQGPELRDICYATQNRQNAVRRLAEMVQLLYVIGAENSSNSNRLRDLGEEMGVTSYLIADASGVKTAHLTGVTALGVTAGASAPEHLVQGVVERLQTLTRCHVTTLDGVQENTRFKLPAEVLSPTLKRPGMKTESHAELLTAAEMRRAEQITIAAGLPAMQLMEQAAEVVADTIMRAFLPQEVLVLCGPGNNGGDGLAMALLLHQAGWPVTVAAPEPERLLASTPETVEQVKRWQTAGQRILPFEPSLLEGKALCVDALFGIGLTREIAGVYAETVRIINENDVPVIAVDIPSGIHADTGMVMGAAIEAECTVTFFRGKPGLYLHPGKAHAGKVEVADIGIPSSVLNEVNPRFFLNTPKGWLHHLPATDMETHKYARGYALVSGGGGSSSGAARLAAMAALRAGAGVVAVTCEENAVFAYAPSLLAVMLKPANDVSTFKAMLAEERLTACLLGPGNGKNMRTKSFTLAALESGKLCVLDADSLNVFEDMPDALLHRLHEYCILTPHEGEFARLFKAGRSADKLSRALQAAQTCKAVIALKGNDTVIAAPDGRASINTNAPASLATAGSGDVLAGIITGLLAQGMPPYEAASAGVWLHGEAAAAMPHALIADDLPELLKEAFLRVFV